MRYSGRTVRHSTRIATLAAASGMLLVLCSGVAPPSAAAAGACWDSVRSDIDGGGPDIVLGLPSYDLPGKADAGAIVIFSGVAAAGSPTPRTPVGRRIVTADDIPGLTATAGARFGTSPVIWNDGPEDGDHCADLLVGAPGETVAGRTKAGRVHLLRGASSGPDAVLQTYDEASLGVVGGAQTGAGFGSALAAETSSAIAVGVPGRDVAGAADAGRVVLLDFLRGGTPRAGVVEQGRSGAGSSEADDRFGEVVHLFGTGAGPVLVVGVPHEDVGSKVDAGAVAALPYGGTLSMVTQDSPGAAGTAEAGDRYGSALDSYATFVVDHPVCIVAVGVPGEDVGSKANAGLVSFAAVDLIGDELSAEPIRGLGSSLTQDSPGVPGSVESGDGFGTSVATAEFGTDGGRLHVAVGAPTEDLGRARDAGMVTMTRIDPQTAKPTSGSQPGAWSQDSSGVSGTAETGDRFGSSLASTQLHELADDDDSTWAVLVATVPGEDLGSVRDAGMSHLGVPPGAGTVSLTPPTAQTNAGSGMQPQHMLVG